MTGERARRGADVYQVPTVSQVLGTHAVNIKHIHNACRERTNLVQGCWRFQMGGAWSSEKTASHTSSSLICAEIIVTVRVGVVDKGTYL